MSVSTPAWATFSASFRFIAALNAVLERRIAVEHRMQGLGVPHAIMAAGFEGHRGGGRLAEQEGDFTEERLALGHRPVPALFNCDLAVDDKIERVRRLVLPCDDERRRGHFLPARLQQSAELAGGQLPQQVKQLALVGLRLNCTSSRKISQIMATLARANMALQNIPPHSGLSGAK